jgi:hypothetical protein
MSLFKSSHIADHERRVVALQIKVLLVPIKIDNTFNKIYNKIFVIHPPVTKISKIPLFRHIQLMMYVVFIICHIHHQLNVSKKWIFAYISDQRMYDIRTICPNRTRKIGRTLISEHIKS